MLIIARFKMPRPKLPRHIFSQPAAKNFAPSEIRGAAEPIVISLEEFEAIRLIDYEGMDQSGAAEIMNVSRQTVGRILKSGRLKLARAVVDGHPFKVDGGCYKLHGPGLQGQKRGGCGRRGRRRNGMGAGRGMGKGRMRGQKNRV
jgi:predicted DNA-binding protein (UPF0251 family)